MSLTHPLEFFVQWHLTERCNLTCRHCYQEGTSRGNELTFEEGREVIGEVSDTLRVWEEEYGLSFNPAFNVTGGEPFLRTDLFPLLEMIAGHGFEVYLLSNGTLIDRPRAEALSSLLVRGVQVSVEGPKRVHDAVRGTGSFAAARRGTDELLRAGLTVTWNMTLSRENAGSFMEMVDLAKAEGVQRLGYSRLVPRGRGASLLPDMLTVEEVERLYRVIAALDPAPLQLVTGDPLCSQLLGPATPPGGDVALGGCAAAVSGITLLPDGTLLPCRRLPIPLGNIREDSLREVWAASPVLTALRDRGAYQGKCGACERWSACRGCRAIAWAWARGEDGFLGDDPQCFL